MREKKDMTPEETKGAQEAARRMIGDILKRPIPDDTPVVYEEKTLLAKLSGKWWVFIIGTEDPSLAITCMSYDEYFRRCNEMLFYISMFDGEEAATQFLKDNIADFTSNGDPTGTDEAPTIN